MERAVEMDRAVGFARRALVRTARHVDERRWGVAVFDEHLHHVRDHNVLWLDTVPAEVEADAVAREVEDAQATLAHRKLMVADEEAGRRLSPGLVARGFEEERLLFMAAHRPPPEPPPHEVIELDEPGQRELRETFLREYAPTMADDVVAQLVQQKARLAETIGARYFVGRTGGDAGSIAELYVEDGIGQIEDVGTLERFRGRGLAKAVVLHALAEARAAGCDLVFLQAEDDDWPKELYKRLGFGAIGRTYIFTRRPADDASP